MDESKFEFLVFQGAPLNMVMRLMARGIEVQNSDGSFNRFILNSPSVPKEYEEFRKIAKHLVWLNNNRQLFVGTLYYKQSVPLPGSPSPGDLMAALDKGYQLRETDQQGRYALERTVSGRVAITNYDPQTLTNSERKALNAIAASNPNNFVLMDIRPGHPGGEFPLFGGIKLGSLNAIIGFLAAGISASPEFDVPKDPRTGTPPLDPAQTLHVRVTNSEPTDTPLSVSYRGTYYSIANTPWDRESFKLFYSLFQMTVTDVSRVGVPITISK